MRRVKGLGIRSGWLCVMDERGLRYGKGVYCAGNARTIVVQIMLYGLSRIDYLGQKTKVCGPCIANYTGAGFIPR